MTHETANISVSGESGSLDQDRPRIYAACLAAYNNGYLHGRWIDATQDPEDIQAEVSAMLRESPVSGAEEWAIHDFEGFEGARLEEYSGIEKAHALALFIVEHGRLGAGVLDHVSGDLDAAEVAFEHYAGEHQTSPNLMVSKTAMRTEYRFHCQLCPEGSDPEPTLIRPPRNEISESWGWIHLRARGSCG